MLNATLLWLGLDFFLYIAGGFQHSWAAGPLFRTHSIEERGRIGIAGETH